MAHQAINQFMYQELFIYLLLTEYFAMCSGEYTPTHNIVSTLKVHNKSTKSKTCAPRAINSQNIESSGTNDNCSWKEKNRGYPSGQTLRKGVEMAVSTCPLQ